MAHYGYVRVSTREQREDRQLAALAALDLPQDHIYIDRQSGKDFERPRYRALMRRLRRNDVPPPRRLIPAAAIAAKHSPPEEK